jgi:putative transposase
VLEALGEQAGAAKGGLLALSVGVGLGVLYELMEAEVDDVVGRKGRHLPDRTAVRHGHDGGEVTLGGRRVPVGRPRARTADGARAPSTPPPQRALSCAVSGAGALLGWFAGRERA